MSVGTDRAERAQRSAFLTLVGLLLLVLVLVATVFAPFLAPLAAAAALALLLAPTQRRLSATLGGRPWLAALLLTLGVALAVVIPVSLMAAAISGQAIEAYGWITPKLSAANFRGLWEDHVLQWFPWLDRVVAGGGGELAGLMADSATRLVGVANAFVQAVGRGLAAATFDILLLLVILFFFLRDGRRFAAQVRGLWPPADAGIVQAADHLRETTRGVLASLIAVPLVQGALCTLAYLVIGLPSALLWGALSALASLVPIAGPPLVWVPICIWLFLDGQVASAVGLFVFGTVVVATSDNIVRPWLLQGTARIHPLLSFLSIIGAVIVFGPIGLLLGPLILSLGVSAMRVYRHTVLEPGHPMPEPVSRRAGAAESGQPAPLPARPMR